MKLTRHNGRAGKNGAYNPKHNDCRFDVENSGHIDPERAKKNIYWDCYQGLSSEAYGEEKQKYSFEDVERIYYFDRYADHVQTQNERNEKSRHTERNRTVEDLLKNKKTCPEETVYQIGTIEESVSGETLAMIAVDFFAEMENRYGEHFHILDWALHVDEGTPHIHERYVFDCENRYGELCPQQEKALEALGVPLPHPDKPKGRNNNRKQTFDADCRELLFSVCEKHGLHLEREPSYGGRGYLEKQDRQRWQGGRQNGGRLAHCPTKRKIWSYDRHLIFKSGVFLLGFFRALPGKEAGSVAEVRDMLEMKDKGNAKNTIGNCLTVFRHDPLLCQSIRYNLLTERVDVAKPLWWAKDTPALTDTNVCYFQYYLEKNYGLTSEKNIQKAIRLTADQNRYHPVRDYLASLVWNGKERIRHARPHFLSAEGNDYTHEALRLFLLGAIHRVFVPGCKFEVMLCLVGGQGAGKSTFFRLLAVRDEWFTDDLKKLDDDNVYRKLQGHWIIEMSEMLATANAKSIEEIKSFLSRSKEVYKIPYETHPADRMRQCVFGGTSNTIDFLPLDRTGNRRFLPVMVEPDKAEAHILSDEDASRAYISQMWAEAMCIYRSGDFRLSFSPAMQEYLKEHQAAFMPEDTKAGMILDFLERYQGDMVCSKQLYKEALNHAFDEPKQWEIREINDIMNHSVTGWEAFKNPRHFAVYGRQKGWMRATGRCNGEGNWADGFVPLAEEEARQMELVFAGQGSVA